MAPTATTLFDGEYCRLGVGLVLSGHGHGGIWRLPFTDGLLGAGGQLLPGFTNGFTAAPTVTRRRSL